MDTLHSCFDHISEHPYVAIHGLGGCGKSAVAIEFAYQTRARSNCAVFWVSAFDALRFMQSYRAIAEALQIPEANHPEKDIMRLVQQKLSQYDRAKWLIIVDNVDRKSVLWDKDPDPNLSRNRLWDKLPRNENGMILFTTRSRGIAVDAAPHDYYLLDKLRFSEAEQFLQKSLHHQPALFSTDAAAEFLESLTYLPLAIVQALAYMKTNNTSIKRYLELLKKADHSMIELLKEDFLDSNRDVNSNNAVAATWLLSFEHIQKDDHNSAEYLFFLACIAPQNIPRSIFPPITTENEQEKAIGTLTGYAFLAQSGERDRYDVHALVHRVTQNWLKESLTWTETAKASVKRLKELIPYNGQEQSKLSSPYLLHGLFTTAIAEIVDEEATIDLLNRVGRCYQSLGEYSNAILTHWEVFNRRDRVNGLNNKATLISMNDLGLALQYDGRYEEAEAMHRRALEATERVLGPEHPSTLTSFDNLGLVLKNRGKYEEAEALRR